MRRRGQLAITVIIAIVVVALVLILFLFPRVNVFVSDVNPSQFLQSCIEPDVRDALEVLSAQGGSLTPDNYLQYQGNNVQYLCYTANNYLPCVVQQPLLIPHVEQELTQVVEPTARQCVRDLVAEYERRGFTVDAQPGEASVEIIPGRIEVAFDAPMTVSKESTQTFQRFAVALDSELYDLLSIATSIVQFESTLGDSETILYLQYYPNLKIEKIERAADGTVYTLSDVTTGDEFVFASRSLHWPPGYDLEDLA